MSEITTPSASGSDNRCAAGFDFDLTQRNAQMSADARFSGKLPRFTKTGTTIVGLCYKDGLVLGADTRATEGPIVADKNCEKIHYMAPNIYCCGAGTAADTDNVTGMIASELELLRLRTRTQSRVVSAMTLLKKHLFRYQGNVSAALVLGGCDITGPHLYTIYPHGSTDKLPFVTMGSGSLAAMAVFEAGYRDDMDEEEAKELVKAAIRSGIFNDLGSGSNVDICVIRKNDTEASQQVQMYRNVETPNEGSELRASVKRPVARDFPRGATAVLRESFEASALAAVEVSDGAEPMAL